VKSITTPAQELEFLGVSVNTLSMSLKLPCNKVKHPRGSPAAAKVTPNLSSVAVTIPRLAECSCPAVFSSSTVLSLSTRRFAEIPISGGGRTTMLCSHCPRRQ